MWKTDFRLEFVNLVKLSINIWCGHENIRNKCQPVSKEYTSSSAAPTELIPPCIKILFPTHAAACAVRDDGALPVVWSLFQVLFTTFWENIIFVTDLFFLSCKFIFLLCYSKKMHTAFLQGLFFKTLQWNHLPVACGSTWVLSILWRHFIVYKSGPWKNVVDMLSYLAYQC